MGPSGSRALFIAVDTKGHLSMKGKIIRNGQLWNNRRKAEWWHFHPRHSWLTHVMLQICFPLLPFEDFITASLKVDINYIAGSLSFSDCTFALEIPRQGIKKNSTVFPSSTACQVVLPSHFLKGHSALLFFLQQCPILASLRSSLPLFPHWAGR